VRTGSLFKTSDDRAVFGAAEPVRHAPAQYARRDIALCAASALTGHDQNKPRASPLRLRKKVSQGKESLPLVHAVEVDRGIRRNLAARKLLAQPRLNWRERPPYPWHVFLCRRVWLFSLWRLDGRDEVRRFRINLRAREVR
jgi:hypothetical protein